MMLMSLLRGSNRRAVPALGVLLVLLTACVSASDSNAATADATERGSAPAADGFTSVAVEDAAVDVSATGLAAPPSAYTDFVPGEGRAFVIDPSGLAIARHHVAAGAASIETSAGPAELVGWSQCDDVALIRIDAPEPLPAVAIEDLFRETRSSVRARIPAYPVERIADVIDRLERGEPVERLGVSLVSMLDRGLWVSGVDETGPAAEIGVAPGDVIVRIGDQQVWEFASQQTLCGVLDEHEDLTGLELYVNQRGEGSELSAPLHGGEALQSTGSQYPPLGFQSVQDLEASFFFYAPEQWDVVPATSPFDDTHSSVRVSPDLDVLRRSFAIDGITLARADNWDSAWIDVALDQLANLLGPNCRLEPSEPYDDGLYVGWIAWNADCGESNTDVALFAAAPTGDDHLIYGIFQITGERGREAMDIALRSLQPQ